MTPFKKEFAAELQAEVQKIANDMKLTGLEIIVELATEREGVLSGLSYRAYTKKYILESTSVKEAFIKELTYDLVGFKRNYKFDYSKFVIGLFDHDEAIMTYSKSYGIDLHDKTKVDSI